jgi:RNA polymerase sigma factor (sigma-70 family)
VLDAPPRPSYGVIRPHPISGTVMANDRLHAILRHVRRTAAPAAGAMLTDAQLLDRYLTHRDESAFGALVRRHGGLVASACRRVLSDENDVEDAFQATFLVLLRKAKSIRNRQTLACWLYRVAGRVATEARAARNRRRRLEGSETLICNLQSEICNSADPSWREVCEMLHGELDRLPPHLRLPLILCYLDGKTRDDAARQLGWRVSTLHGRLERGRLRLRSRLARRGVDLSAALLATAAASRTDAAGPTLVRAAVRLASGVTPSAAVTALATGAMRVAIGVPAAIVTGLMIVAGLYVGVAAGRGPTVPPGQAIQPQAAQNAPPAATEDIIAYGGRVLGPDGKPVAGAKMHMTPAWGYPHYPSPSTEYSQTGPDGHFRFAVPKAQFGRTGTVVAAMAANFGAGWVAVAPDGNRDDLTIRLVDDDVPVTGQIIDLEGRPVAGVTLTVMQINAAPREDLGAWLEAVKAKKGLRLQLEQDYLKRYTIALPLRATTDAAGQFRLTGVGRNRLVAAQLDGPTIASQQIHMLTRPGPAIKATEHEGQSEYGDPRKVVTYYGATFRLAAAPTKPLGGVVRDNDTRKPLAGVKIWSHTRAIGPGATEQFDIVRTTTDAEGRYRLVGLPKGDGFRIAAVPAKDQPYVSTTVAVPASPGLDQVALDIELKRGVWIEGKLTDKVTGKPLQGAVEYYSLYSNPNLADYPGFGAAFLDAGSLANEDGAYRVVGLPGPGLVGVYYQRASYLRADKRDDEFGTKERSLSTAPYQISFTSNFNALARVDPAKGADSAKRDVTLDPGWNVKVAVVGPDGKPLPGTRCFGLSNYQARWDGEETKTSEFTAWYDPTGWQHEIIFQHTEKRLVGVAQPPTENGGHVTVRMAPGAAVTGRLVDADGNPRAAIELEVKFKPKGFKFWPAYRPEPIKTDRDGRFEISTLLPGCEFRLTDGAGEWVVGDALRSGQTVDLGDVRMKPGITTD